MRQLALRIAVVLACSLLCGSAVAEVGDDQIARQHYATGTTYFEAGRFAEATREFLDAYRLSHRPAFLYNIGVAYEKAGDVGRATGYYQRYLQAAPNADERVEIEARMFRFSSRVAKLVIHTSGQESEVWIDGAIAGLAPLDPVVLTEGPHAVEVRRSGCLPAQRDVTLKGGFSMEVTLEPQPPAPITQEPVVPQPAPASSGHGWLVAVLGGVGAAVIAGVIIGLLVTATDYRASERSNCPAGSCSLIDFTGGK